MKLCSINGCGRKHRAHGLCNAHYLRLRRHDDPLGISPPKLGPAQQFFNEVVLPYDGIECLLWPHSTDGQGYAQVSHDGRLQHVSRLVCEDEHGPPPSPLHQAAHSCGKGHLSCVTRRHLSWKTRPENEADKLVHGTSNRGDAHGMSKLALHDIQKIISLKGHASQRQIAKDFGISQQHVSSIHRGERWGWASV